VVLKGWKYAREKEVDPSTSTPATMSAKLGLAGEIEWAVYTERVSKVGFGTAGQDSE
jgi:hypothetical protein